ncbi:hypothetical protein Q4574_10565 [Aliiglaciecola sp. 3_MG-2023]|uniref:hypothetical protein n=1 Tax=Aliiglaciecola sp. 3_MG-2023 TaxID=3062644 RepID=UPI0026E29C68|nr:hypothetical protein [Aliiglaciecola sp. 3_MG-2023]MDO6693730.1 hypothetical protein [Aliiglaciecola sp. 3_MG-2023]
MSANTSLPKKCGLVLLVVYVLSLVGVIYHAPNKFELEFLFNNALIENVLTYLVANLVVVFVYCYVSRIKVLISIVSGLVTLLAMPMYGLYIACYVGGC